MKRALISAVAMVLAVMFFSFIQKPTSWEVPAEFKNKNNPVKKTDKVIAEGKKYYTQVCAGCHGTSGHGDGVKVKNRDILPASLVREDSRKETDGEHFYKIKYGRGIGNLHSFKGSLEDENIWSIVHYIKELK